MSKESKNFGVPGAVAKVAEPAPALDAFRDPPESKPAARVACDQKTADSIEDYDPDMRRG